MSNKGKSEDKGFKLINGGLFRIVQIAISLNNLQPCFRALLKQIKIYIYIYIYIAEVSHFHFSHYLSSYFLY